LFKPYLINMNVHSATCRCSVELYKQWYILADFFPNWIFPGFSLRFTNLGAQWKDSPSYCDFLRGLFFILFAGRISEAAMGRTGVGGHNMINMTIRELYYAFADFFQNWNFSQDFLYIILISPKGTTKMRWGGGGGPGGTMYFLGCSVAQLGCSVAQ
jgi:hypothetical protein